MQIGKVKVDNNVWLAPLAGVSDVGFRMLCRGFGAGLTYTEMVSAKGLLYNNKRTAALLECDDTEKPRAVQLFGAEPEAIAAAIQNPLLAQFDIIDVNMGCPVDKVVRAGEGSALMRTPELAERIIRAAVQAAGDRPVTVKFRAGFDSNNINAPEFAAMCQSAGAALVTVHGRTRTQMYSGKSDNAVIAAVVRAVRIPVIANGDITDRASMLQTLDQTGAAGAMIGRAALGRPYIFARLLGVEAEFCINDLIARHIARLKVSTDDRTIALSMRKHVAWYYKGVRGGKEVREAVNAATSTQQILQIIDSYSHMSNH